MTIYDEFVAIRGRGFSNVEYIDWLELQIEKYRATKATEGSQPAVSNTSGLKLPFDVVEAGKRLHIVDAVGRLSKKEYASGAVAMYVCIIRETTSSGCLSTEL